MAITQSLQEEKMLPAVDMDTQIDGPITTLAEATSLGKIFFASKMFPDINSAYQAVAKIIIGREYGFSPSASMSNIAIVKGKHMLMYPAIAGKIKAHPKYDFKVLKSTDEECEMEFFERVDGKWESMGIESFTVADAKKWGTGNMDKFPKIMLRARCLGNGARLHCSEVFLGMPVYVQGEPMDEPELAKPQPQTRAAQVIGKLGGQPEPEDVQDAEFTEPASEEFAEEVPEPEKPTVLPYAEFAARIGWGEGERKTFQSVCSKKKLAATEVVRAFQEKGGSPNADELYQFLEGMAFEGGQGSLV